MSDNQSSRRSFLKGSAIVGSYLAASPAIAKTPRGSAIVVGAGAFGGWSALQLLRQGVKVTLVDAWGPGNTRSSSGSGETRIIRATYGPKRIYTEMVIRAAQLWKAYEREWKIKLFNRAGMLWFVSKDDSYEQAALPLLRQYKVPFEQLSIDECAKRWPQIKFDDVAWGLYEPEAGYLNSHRACGAVFDAFIREGGEYRQAQVVPGAIASNRMDGVKLSGGEVLQADSYVFACGPWLGTLFPVLKPLITASRQEVFFFGSAAGDTRFTDPETPVWIDNGKHIFYGIPGNNGRGFKIANDVRGVPIDPTVIERQTSPAELAAARDYLRLRFPELADAPLLESCVCQYENAPRDRFIIDRHPEAQNTWIVGGGSGHGFKHGPVVGEIVRDAVLEVKAPSEEMSLALALETKRTM